MGTVTLDTHSTIECVRPLRETLMTAIDTGGGLVVDASALEFADVSVLQLIVSARKTCEARGTKFTLIGGNVFSLLAAKAGLQPDVTFG